MGCGGADIPSSDLSVCLTPDLRFKFLRLYTMPPACKLSTCDARQGVVCIPVQNKCPLLLGNSSVKESFGNSFSIGDVLGQRPSVFLPGTGAGGLKWMAWTGQVLGQRISVAAQSGAWVLGGSRR